MPRVAEWYRVDGLGSSLAVSRYPVTGATPCGVWLDDFGRRRWVSTTAKKRFAYPTRVEAIESFKARKKRQIVIMERQLVLIRGQLALVESEPPLDKDFVHGDDRFVDLFPLDPG